MTDWNSLGKETMNKVLEEKQSDNVVSSKIEFKSLQEVKENRGIKILSYGNFSTGKTHFALTSNEPVYIIDTENGASPLANKFPNVKSICISNMDDEDIEEKDEVRNFEKFMEVIDYLCSLPDNEVGTVIIDSLSDIWEWAQAYAKVKIFKISIEDRLKQQWDWGIINKIYKKQLQKLIDKNCNLIMTARESEVYDGPGKPSGRFEPKCQKKTPYMVDVVLYHEVKMINKQLMFSVRIDKCRQNGKLVGTTIINSDFNKLKEMIK